MVHDPNSQKGLKTRILELERQLADEQAHVRSKQIQLDRTRELQLKLQEQLNRVVFNEKGEITDVLVGNAWLPVANFELVEKLRHEVEELQKENKDYERRIMELSI